MRELFNIDIEYVFLAAKEQYDERVNLMLASGDLPDVMNVSLTQMHQMIDGDQILAGQDPEELRQEAGSVVRILMTGTWKQMMKNWILTEQIIGGYAYDGENEQMVVCT